MEQLLKELKWLPVKVLGKGSYGVVIQLTNTITNDKAAVKKIILKDDSKAGLMKIENESKIHQTLEHKNIVNFYAGMKDGPLYYIFMELVEGGTLRDKIFSHGAMDEIEAKKLFSQLIQALQYLHDLGISHRDLKPQNLLLDSIGNLKLADFGLAVFQPSSGVQSVLTRICGTSPYMAPEVLAGMYRGEIADLWSAGIILAYMIKGVRPWDIATDNCQEFLKWKNRVTGHPLDRDGDCFVLVKRLLNPNLAQRLTIITQILGDTWMTQP